MVMVTDQLNFIWKHFIKLRCLWFNCWLCNPPIRKWCTVQAHITSPKLTSQCMPLSFHSLQVNQLHKIAPRMHQNSRFWAQKSKNFLGRGHSPLSDPSPGGQGDTPFPHPVPLAPRSSRLWRSTRLDCHGSYGVLATPLLMVAVSVKIPKMERLRTIRRFPPDFKYSADHISLICLPCHISASPHFTTRRCNH